MKQSILRPMGLIGLLVLVVAGRPDSRAEQNRTRDVMRFKLHYAQGVLEGITTENYELIATNAVHLKKLSQAADWNVRQTQEYQRFTRNYERHAESLERAARKNNVEAATVAYFQLTLSCVDCHRYLRDSRLASVPRLVPVPVAGTAPAEPPRGRRGPGRSP